MKTTTTYRIFITTGKRLNNPREDLFTLIKPIFLGGCTKVDKILITGGKALKGEVHISGAKNAAVAILPAALLISGKCVIENIPDISDVDSILSMMNSLGAEVSKTDNNTVVIDATNLHTWRADPELTLKMRAS